MCVHQGRLLLDWIDEILSVWSSRCFTVSSRTNLSSRSSIGFPWNGLLTPSVCSPQLTVNLAMSFSYSAAPLDPHSTQQNSPNSMQHQHYMSPLTGSSSSSTGGSPTTAANMPLLASIANVKDSRWLTLEVCREYQRGKCTRSEQECKFAHPPTHVEVNSGKVIACFDSLKVRSRSSAIRDVPVPDVLSLSWNSALLSIVEKPSHRRRMGLIGFLRRIADESVEQKSLEEWFLSKMKWDFQIKSANRRIRGSLTKDIYHV